MPRCKVGDLAIVVRSETPATAPNLGAIVAVVAAWPAPAGYPGSDVWWLVLSRGRDLVGFDVHTSRLVSDARPMAMPDGCLMPLRDGAPDLLTVEDLDAVLGGVVDWGGGEARVTAGGRG